MLDLPFVLIFLAAIAAIGGWLVLIPTIGAAVLILATLLISPLVKRIYVRSASGRTRQQRFLIEALSGMRAIKFAGAEGVWMGRFRDMSAEDLALRYLRSMVDFKPSAALRVVQEIRNASEKGQARQIKLQRKIVAV